MILRRFAPGTWANCVPASWLLVLAFALWSSPSTAQTIITVDPAARYQTISGWECVTFASQDDPAFPLFKDALFVRVINEAGINRVRLEVRSGAENRSDILTVRSLKPGFTGSLERSTDLSQADDWREVGASTGSDFLFNWSGPLGATPAFYRFRQP